MQKMLTVAHVNLAKGFRGGERQTELLIKALSLKGLKQILVCRSSSPLIDHLQGVDNLEIIALSGRIHPRFLGHIKLGSRADIIQAHETKAAQWALLHHLLYRTAYSIVRRVDEKVRVNFFNRLMYKKARFLVAVSKLIADYLSKTFMVDVHVIHDCSAHLHPDEQNVKKLKEQYKDKFVIGHVGALVDAHKGQSTIIRSVPYLREQIPNLKVLLIGSGKDEIELKNLAKDMPEVEFLGFKDNVADYLKCMDVFVYPSNHEGLGSTILDAMEQGVPVVATDVGGIPELVLNGKTGLLIEPQDSQTLAEKIISIRTDGILRKNLITNGKIAATHNSSEQVADRYFSLFEKFIPSWENRS